VEMIDTLLDVHKFEAGKMKMALKLDDPCILLEKIFNRYLPVAKRAQVDLSLEKAENLPEVSFDRGKINRVIGNLLSNAFKFTAEGGKVTINVEMIDNPATVISRISKGLYPDSSLAQVGRYLMVSVIDNGVGIPADSLENIFDRFAQARNRALGKTRGTGLGLAFCRKVMDAHNGFIWAESSEGHGSNFRVLLPVDSGRRG
jgi:two-component system phosphate regulon sensor histidine kinase PhoR